MANHGEPMSASWRAVTSPAVSRGPGPVLEAQVRPPLLRRYGADRWDWDECGGAVFKSRTLERACCTTSTTRPSPPSSQIIEPRHRHRWALAFPAVRWATWLVPDLASPASPPRTRASVRLTQVGRRTEPDFVAPWTAGNADIEGSGHGGGAGGPRRTRFPG